MQIWKMASVAIRRSLPSISIILMWCYWWPALTQLTVMEWETEKKREKEREKERKGRVCDIWEKHFSLHLSALISWPDFFSFFFYGAPAVTWWELLLFHFPPNLHSWTCLFQANKKEMWICLLLLSSTFDISCTFVSVPSHLHCVCTCVCGKERDKHTEVQWAQSNAPENLNSRSVCSSAVF